MPTRKTLAAFCALALLVLGVQACTKKGDFVNEAQLGTGVHYYPVILNSRFYDTLSRKYLNLTDTVFSPGETLVFGLGYFSRNPAASLQLWAGKSRSSLEKALDITAGPRLIDTVFFRYTLPVPKDSMVEWYLQARVVTEAGLSMDLNAEVRIR